MEHFLLFSIVLTLITMISMNAANPQIEEIDDETNEGASSINDLGLETVNTRSSTIIVKAKEAKKKQPKKDSLAERAPSPTAPEIPGSSERGNTSSRLGTS